MKNINKMILNLPVIIKWILAALGLFNNIFINDKEYMIRLQVAKRGYKLDKLVDDEILHIRKLAYSAGYHGKQLLNEHIYVKEELIMNGKFLDKFIDDTSEYIRRLVVKYCEMHPFDEECKKILSLYKL